MKEGLRKYKCPLTMMIMALFICILVIATCTGCSRWYTAYGLSNSQLKSKESLPNLLRALDDPSPRTRQAALKYISRLRRAGREAIPNVVELVKNDPDEKVRAYAIRTLGQIMPCTQKNIDLMQEIINANSGEMVSLAENVLTTIKNRDTAGAGISADYGLVHLDDGVEIEITPAFDFYNGYVTIQPSIARYMLPIEIQINNQTNSSISMSADNVKFFDDKGVQKSLLSVDEAIKRQHFSVGKSIILGFPVVSQIKTGRANGMISKYCEEIVLTAFEVLPGETVKKVLFFDCPLRPRQIAGWQLDFTCVEKAYGKKMYVKYIFGSGEEITIEQIPLELPLSSKNPTNPTTLENKLLELKHLKDKKLITEEEYFEKRKSLIRDF